MDAHLGIYSKGYDVFRMLLWGEKYGDIVVSHENYHINVDIFVLFNPLLPTWFSLASHGDLDVVKLQAQTIRSLTLS